MVRPVAYEGTEPYIFISYAHQDSDRVLPIISALQEQGFRVWYDVGGNDADMEWLEHLAERLESCSVFLSFLSQIATDSPNCRREINFAIDERKEMLIIYLDEFRLSAGMRMQLGVLQAMFFYRHNSLESFMEELCRSQILSACCAAGVTSSRKPELEAIAALFEYTQTDDGGIEITDLIDRNSTKIAIPWGVTSIGRYAFMCCSNITHVFIPDSVTSIGELAFSGCEYLTSIDIPSGVTSIGEGAFNECRNLTNITIPHGVTSIGTGAFQGCKKLTTIPIPSSVTSIGEDAFLNCDNLTICGTRGSAAMRYATKNKIPFRVSYYDGTESGIRKPDLRAIAALFEYTQADDGSIEITSPKNEDITRIEIPWGVTSIGESAFFYCTSLTSIIVSDSVTSIGKKAFCNCHSLTNITIPDSVTSIGDSAFSFCENLTHITIPNSVTSIGELAFAYCINLTSITIPNSVTIIGGWTFDSCNKLTICSTRGSVAERYAAYHKLPFRITCPDDIAPAVREPDMTAIAALFEYTQTDDGSIEITGLNDESSTDIEIPWGVTSIGENAFFYCCHLTSITIPGSVTNISDGAFSLCKNLTHIAIPYGVTSIGNSIFNQCTNLTDITIPDSVTRIGELAFCQCINLTSITIPDSVTSIGKGAFDDCSGLTIRGKRSSVAAQYAAENKIPFIAI